MKIKVLFIFAMLNLSVVIVTLIMLLKKDLLIGKSFIENWRNCC